MQSPKPRREAPRDGQREALPLQFSNNGTFRTEIDACRNGVTTMKKQEVRAAEKDTSLPHDASGVAAASGW